MWGEEEKKISALDKNVNRLLVAGSVTQKKTHTHTYSLSEKDKKNYYAEKVLTIHTHTHEIYPKTQHV